MICQELKKIVRWTFKRIILFYDSVFMSFLVSMTDATNAKFYLLSLNPSGSISPELLVLCLALSLRSLVLKGHVTLFHYLERTSQVEEQKKKRGHHANKGILL